MQRVSPSTGVSSRLPGPGILRGYFLYWQGYLTEKSEMLPGCGGGCSWCRSHATPLYWSGLLVMVNSPTTAPGLASSRTDTSRGPLGYIML